MASLFFFRKISGILKRGETRPQATQNAKLKPRVAEFVSIFALARSPDFTDDGEKSVENIH